LGVENWGGTLGCARIVGALCKMLDGMVGSVKMLVREHRSRFTRGMRCWLLRPRDVEQC
jgi:hypothetical protein